MVYDMENPNRFFPVKPSGEASLRVGVVRATPPLPNTRQAA